MGGRRAPLSGAQLRRASQWVSRWGDQLVGGSGCGFGVAGCGRARALVDAWFKVSFAPTGSARIKVLADFGGAAPKLPSYRGWSGVLLNPPKPGAVVPDQTPILP